MSVNCQFLSRGCGPTGPTGPSGGGGGGVYAFAAGTGETAANGVTVMPITLGQAAGCTFTVPSVTFQIPAGSYDITSNGCYPLYGATGDVAAMAPVPSVWYPDAFAVHIDTVFSFTALNTFIAAAVSDASPTRELKMIRIGDAPAA